MTRYSTLQATISLYCDRCGSGFRCSYRHIATLCAPCAVADAKARVS